MRKFLKQRLVIWIAMLSVLFGALAPTISRAMVASALATEEVQICTTTGIVTMVVGPSAAGKPSTPTPDHIFNHCPYCAIHGGSLALPPVPIFVLPVIRQPRAHPALFYQSAAPLFAWTVSNPRAPPTVA